MDCLSGILYVKLLCWPLVDLLWNRFNHNVIVRRTPANLLSILGPNVSRGHIVRLLLSRIPIDLNTVCLIAIVAIAPIMAIVAIIAITAIPGLQVVQCEIMSTAGIICTADLSSWVHTSAKCNYVSGSLWECLRVAGLESHGGQIPELPGLIQWPSGVPQSTSERQRQTRECRPQLSEHLGALATKPGSTSNHSGVDWEKHLFWECCWCARKS